MSEERPVPDMMITWAAGSADHTGLLVDCGCTVTWDYDDFTVLSPVSEAEAVRIADLLSGRSDVICVEQDFELDLTGISNDYLTDTQWSLNNTGSYVHKENSSEGTISTTKDIDIDAPEGWALYRSNSLAQREVIVAVIDTGIDYKHPDLENSMWINPGEIPDNGIDDDKNGFIDDVYGWDFYNGDASVCHYEYNERYDAELSSPSDCDDHGTHCAGIIAASVDNSIGIAGIAGVGPVKLMSLKIHGGTDRKGTVSDAIKAIKYADRAGARVCNLSWGAYTYSTSLRTAMESSRMLFICAAGNDGIDNDDRPLYPASFKLPNIISVTHVDANGKLTYDSNYGRKTVDFAVPSTDIFSTTVGTYASMTGSSMAAPHVTAIAALLFTCSDNLYASNVKEIIIDSLKPCANVERLVKYPGIPSLSGALERVLAGALKPDTVAPSLSIKRTFEGDALKIDINTSDEGGSGNHLTRYFIGSRKLTDFENGTAGTIVSDNIVSLAKAGKYTFYADDAAGNTTLLPVYIPDDYLAPVISDLEIAVNNKQTTITVSGRISDTQSGVKNLRYLAGKHTSAEFVSGEGESIEIGEDGEFSFKTGEEGLYSIYTSDRRGNRAVTYVQAYIRRSTAISLSLTDEAGVPVASTGSAVQTGTDTLPAGTPIYVIPVDGVFRIDALMTPELSTDRINYTSSNPEAVTVTRTGKITGIAPGTATITATTSSDCSAYLFILVEKPAS